jgi:hypothetical protein
MGSAPAQVAASLSVTTTSLALPARKSSAATHVLGCARSSTPAALAWPAMVCPAALSLSSMPARLTTSASPIRIRSILDSPRLFFSAPRSVM